MGYPSKRTLIEQIETPSPPIPPKPPKGRIIKEDIPFSFFGMIFIIISCLIAAIIAVNIMENNWENNHQIICKDGLQYRQNKETKKIISIITENNLPVRYYETD